MNSEKKLLRQVEKVLYENKYKTAEDRHKDFQKVTKDLTPEDRTELEKAAVQLHRSRNILDEMIKDSNFKYCTEPIRRGFVGKKIFDRDGTIYVQACRGPIIGYLAAVKGDTKDNPVFYGMSFISQDERYPHKLIGQVLAIEDAVNKKSGQVDKDKIKKNLNSEVQSQLNHFEKRSLAYFYPEQYSFSRGPKKGIDDVYDEIHMYQFACEILNAKKVEVIQNTFGKLKEICKNRIRQLSKDPMVVQPTGLD